MPPKKPGKMTPSQKFAREASQATRDAKKSGVISKARLREYIKHHKEVRNVLRKFD